MTREEFLTFHKEFVCRMVKQVEAKNHDYSASDKAEYAFNNLVACEKIGACTTEQGFIARLMDKVMRITCFIKAGTLKVKEEKIEDTIMDACNYLILLAGYLKSKRKESRTITPTITFTEE